MGLALCARFPPPTPRGKTHPTSPGKEVPEVALCARAPPPSKVLQHTQHPLGKCLGKSTFVLRFPKKEGSPQPPLALCARSTLGKARHSHTPNTPCKRTPVTGTLCQSFAPPPPPIKSLNTPWLWTILVQDCVPQHPHPLPLHITQHL
jgi:hypothetical protein